MNINPHIRHQRLVSLPCIFIFMHLNFVMAQRWWNVATGLTGPDILFFKGLEKGEHPKQVRRKIFFSELLTIRHFQCTDRGKKG